MLINACLISSTSKRIFKMEEEDWLDPKFSNDCESPSNIPMKFTKQLNQVECGKLFRDAHGMIYFHCCHCQKEFEYIAEFAMHLADDHPKLATLGPMNYPEIKPEAGTVVMELAMEPAYETDSGVLLSTKFTYATETDEPSLPQATDISRTKSVLFSSTVLAKRKRPSPEWRAKRRKPVVMKRCLMCRERFTVSDLGIHLAKLGPTSPPTEIQCPNCSRSFQARCKLQQHLRYIHSDEFKKHKCHLCDKKYRSPGALEIHLRTHAGIKPFECNECGKCCSSKTLLRVHFRRVHSGKKPFQCWHCGEHFTDNCYLKYHIQVKHTADKGKTLQCDKCEKTFVAAHRLKIHYRSHTGERPYPCKSCEKAFTCVELLNVHMTQKHINARSFKCSQCPRAFNIKGKLTIHEKTVHKSKQVKTEFSDSECYD